MARKSDPWGGVLRVACLMLATSCVAYLAWKAYDSGFKTAESMLAACGIGVIAAVLARRG